MRPTVTTTDALIHTGQELCRELTTNAPDSMQTKNAIETLMKIFKVKDRASREEVACGPSEGAPGCCTGVEEENRGGDGCQASEDAGRR